MELWSVNATKGDDMNAKKEEEKFQMAQNGQSDCSMSSGDEEYKVSSDEHMSEDSLETDKQLDECEPELNILEVLQRERWSFNYADYLKFREKFDFVQKSF